MNAGQFTKRKKQINSSYFVFLQSLSKAEEPMKNNQME
jgi:hypothetical protein